MRDRQYRDRQVVIFIACHKHDGARTILYAFFLTALMLAAPQVRVADNEAGNGLGERQEPNRSIRGRKRRLPAAVLRS